MKPKEPSESKTTVFISSTFLDNEDRRRLVEDAVLRAGMTPVGMEHLTASHQPTVDECGRWPQAVTVRRHPGALFAGACHRVPLLSVILE
jgi:hypothetical protein